MKKLNEMTAKEVLKELNPNEVNFSEVAESAVYCATTNENIIVEQVQHVGGEGQGETYFYVYKVTNVNDKEDFVFIKFNGYYTSDYGTDWDNEDYALVVPTSVTRIEYL